MSRWWAVPVRGLELVSLCLLLSLEWTVPALDLWGILELSGAGELAVVAAVIAVTVACRRALDRASRLPEL